MKLHWTSRSPYVRMVTTTIHELGLGEQVELVKTFVNINAPNAGLMESNPLNKIPTLVVRDGTVLHDSRVICQYLSEVLGGGALMPEGQAERYGALTRQAFGVGLVDLLLFWLIERNRPEAHRARDVIAANEVKFAATLDRLEHSAADLARIPLDLGHIAIGTALGYADFRFGDLGWRNGRPALAGWCAEYARRPSVLADPFFDDIAAAKLAERKR
jgi:glutathione S-transferase